MSSPILRKDAPRRPTSPERLDQAPRITTSREWVALAACGLLLATALAWSVLGTYRVTVQGAGLLHAENGLFINVFAPRSGWIDYLAPVGEEVRRGQLIAKLDAPENRRQLAELRKKRDQLARQREAIVARYDELQATEDKANATKRSGLEETARLTAERVAALEQLMTDREGLRARGFGTAETVLQTRERLFAAREQLARVDADLKALDAAPLVLQGRRAQELEALDRQIQDTMAQIAQTHVTLGLTTDIVSRDDGRVVMAPATPHSLVAAGQRILTIESGGPGLEVTAFVPAEQGKSVRLGMPVRVSPSTARREEYGALVGRVVWVSPLPRSQKEIADALGQEDLARQFAGRTPPIAIRVALVPDPAFDAGYRWTSDKGAEVALTSGTLVTAWITIREAPPITLVIPALRAWLGL